MTVESELAEQRQKLAGRAALQEAVRDMLSALADSGALDGALEVGGEFPNFLLPDAEGALVSRDRLLARGPFVLAFLRGGWCPYCAIALRGLLRAQGEFARRGAALCVATPETNGRALDLKRAHEAGCAVLSDVDSGLAAACGVLFHVPPGYRGVLEGVGIDIAERQGNAAGVLPVPATFVVGRDGLVRWRHLDPDFTRRAEPSDILAALG